MSELPITPLLGVPAFQAIGDDAAGFCADGVCAVPDAPSPVEDGPAADHPQPAR